MNKLARFADSKPGTFFICLVFSLIMIHPWVFPLKGIPALNGSVWSDPAHSIWTLWLVNENLSSGRSPYHTNMIFYPLGADLTHHTLSPGFFPVVFLIKQLSGGDPMYPVYAYRIIIWLCFTLLLFFTYLLLRQAGFTRWAAAIGAVAFSFSDFFIEHAAHISLLSAFFIPLTGLLLLRLYRQPSTATALAASLTAGVAIYFTELALYLFLGLLFVLIAIFLIRDERKTLLDKLRLLGLRRLLLAVGVCLAVMMPFLIAHFSSEVVKPLPVESSNFSANLVGFLIPDPQRNPLYGNLSGALSAQINKGLNGRETFIGFPLLVFAVIGLLYSRQNMVRAAALVSLVFLILSLGPTLKVFGSDTGWPLPYALLMKIPPFDLGRTPVRFVMMGILFLTFAAAAGITWTGHALKSRLGSPWSFVAGVVLFGWVVAESYSPMPRQPAFVPPAELAQLVNGPVLNLPASRFDGYAALLQVFHQRPIATGYISRFLPQQINHVENIARAIDSDGPGMCEELQKLGIRNVILNPVSLIEAPFDLSNCQINVVDLRRKNVDYSVYQMGTRIEFSRPEADQYLGYGWSVPETAARWTDRGKAVIAFRMAPAGAAMLRLRLAPLLVAGKLDQQRLSIKINNQPLGTLTLQESEAREYSTLVPARLLSDQNVLTLELPDAESPKNLGISEDTRRLGVAVQWLQIDPAPGL
ncbi:MAG: hypothetical protein ABI596_06690 [Pyrinomonadaceae bacterium]